jgi:hypothetical protein
MAEPRNRCIFFAMRGLEGLNYLAAASVLTIVPAIRVTGREVLRAELSAEAARSTSLQQLFRTEIGGWARGRR